MMKILFLLIGLAGFAFAQDVVRWDMHVAWPEANYHTQGAQRFAERVSERSGGRLEITVHSGGALGYSGPEILRVVQRGALPIAEVFMPNVLGDEPIFGLSEMPIVNEYDGAFELYQLGKPYYEQALARNNQRLLYVAPWAPQGLYTQNRIETAQDLSILRTRTAGPNVTRFVEEVGARALTIPFGELFSSLATGLIDSVVTSPETGVDASLWEVTDYFIEGFVPVLLTDMVTVNTDALGALPEEVREVVLEVAAELEGEMWELAQERQAVARETIQERGLTLIAEAEIPADIQAAREAAADAVLEAWLAEVGEDGQTIVEAFRSRD